MTGIETLDAFVKKLGLRFVSVSRLQSGKFEELFQFDWEHDKKAGRKWDHFVYVLTFSDRTWTCALDVGIFGTKCGASLEAMAKAQEKALSGEGPKTIIDKRTGKPVTKETVAERFGG